MAEFYDAAVSGADPIQDRPGFAVYTVVSEDLRASSRAILTDADRLKKAHCRATV